MNTADYKCFKLHSDSTLKHLTKDELISYIHMLHHNWGACDESYYNVMNLAKELQKELDNPPLKFEDLIEGMWVWDNKHKEYAYLVLACGEYIHLEYIKNLISDCKFEDNRFYRVEVKQ